jgi:hypothetical protein
VGQSKQGFENLSYMGIMKLGLMTNQQQASALLKATGKLKATVQIFSQTLWLEIHTYKL